MNKFNIIPPDIIPQEHRKKEEKANFNFQKKSKKFWPNLIIIILAVFILAGGTFFINDIKLIPAPPDSFNENLTIPEQLTIQASVLPVSLNIQKRIEVNLKSQTLILFEDDKQISQHIISSGKRTTSTKTGNFSVVSKYPVAYGSGDGQLWTMPFFMGIYTVAGAENGIHELPFINGWRETSRDLGRPVSHGCIRLAIGEAEIVYNWAELGIPVWVHY